MKKFIVILAALSLILLMSFTVLADTSTTADDPPKIPYVDFRPGSLLIGINDNMRISKENLQNPAAVFPDVDMISVRDLTPGWNIQILCMDLGATSLEAMREAIEVLKQNPCVKYIEVNSLFKNIEETVIPPELTVAFSTDMDGVVLTLETEKTQYYYNEPIRIKATVKNNTDETIIISSPHGGIGTFFKVGITKADDNTLRLLNVETPGLSNTMIVLRRPVEPGEEFSQSFFTYETWRTLSGNFALAPPGVYNVTASLWYTQHTVEFPIEIEPEAALSNTPARVTVDGALLCQNSGKAAQVELFDSEGNLAYFTKASDNAYTLSARPGSGYTLKVTKPGYLSYSINELELTDGATIETVDLRQLAGDIDGDGVINATDLTLLLSEFNHKPVNYPNADIDDNGIVNATDLTYLLAGFNKHNVEVN